ncbi:MAG: carnitine 3-dehydrogenase [Alphaproteobacteria bacterium]|nr:carnitine 3-dehydrogenase [Alphaproteobacteria bacterium]
MTDRKTAAIIGGGVIGGGWAARFLLAGWNVQIHDPDPQAERKINAVLANARRSLPGLANEALPTEGTLSFHGSIASAARDAALIIEAVPERLAVKYSVYAEIEAANKTALIASSTSGIMPTDLQANMTSPERLIVAHPFNPVYLLPLVELVAGEKTDPKNIERAKQIFTTLGMHPLHCRVEIEGFLSDRLQEALWREALWLLKDGVATTEELDAAIAYGPGLRWAQMGTMQTFHLAGGEGGMRAMLAMFGPCLKWPWTKLMDVPELTDEFVETVGAQCDQQSAPLSPRDLEQIRDANLVAILRALKAQNWGAGQTLAAHDQHLRADDTPDFSAPLRTMSRAVPLDWTDYNGHMNEARYLEAFSKATDRFMELVGCDQAYIAGGFSYFTAETHIRHLDETCAGERIYMDSLCLSGSGKKLHIFNSLYREDGHLLATGEQILIHVSLKSRKATLPSETIARNLARIEKLHAQLPRPEGVGRAIGQALSRK